MASDNRTLHRKSTSSERHGSGKSGNVPRSQAYIHGSAVPKVQPDENFDHQEKRKEQQKLNSKVRKNQKKALKIDLPYLVMLVAASCCTLFICINYLQVQTTTTRRMDRIKALEQELDSLRAENDILQTRINTSVDLDHVYQVATEELGMVYAGKSQVRMYHQTESEFVRQYEDLPTY